VRVLLNLGADIDRRSTEYLTPLMIASSQKHPEVVKWLVKAGADTQILIPDIPGSNAATVLRQVGASVEQTAYLRRPRAHSQAARTLQLCPASQSSGERENCSKASHRDSQSLQ
jgi:ankyrin repeat protein